MIRTALFVLSLLFTAPVMAQGVPVRSGAHDGFDRLTIDLPRRIAYRIEPDADGATIVFDAQGLRFDLGAVFARIDRRRLRDVVAPPEQGRLRLELSCDCELRPFWHGRALLVIDIAERPSGPRRASPVSRPALRPVLPVPSPAADALAARLGPPPVPEMTAESPPPAPPPDLEAMRAALLNQLGRAVSQGLVSAAPEAHQRDLARPSTEAPGPVVDETAPLPPERPAAPAAPVALRARTSMDRDVTGPRVHAAPPSPAPDCPATELLDVPSWGGPEGLPADMGRLYRALFGEFDVVDPKAAQALARLYIHHGFGAEARQVLGLAGRADSEVRLLGELALLVDQEPLPGDSVLRRSIDCGEPAVFWALLALGSVDEALVFDHAALRRSFAALPAGLRNRLGPGLVRRLVAVGHFDTARHLQRMIDRVAEPGEPEIGLARADLAEHAAQPDAQALAEVSRTNSAQAAEALAREIEGALARGVPVTMDKAQLAGAYALELRDTPIGGRLAVAHVSALAASGAFDEAATEFDRLAPDPAHPVARAMGANVLREITRSADDLTFLRYVLGDRFLPPGAMPESLAAAIARRLLDTGFAEAADRILQPGATDPALRLLRAESALMQQRPAEAELALLGLDGPEADLLRARARSLRGDHATAQGLFAATDLPPEADRAALHSRDPEALSRASDPLLRRLGDLLRDPPGPADDAGAAIDRTEALLAETEIARATLARLLDEFPPPSVDAQ